MSGVAYTFKANRDRGRHGWLRLTPAYSVQLVEEMVDSLTAEDRVIDPFCGTGTTALVCADRGIACETVDINPFLVWLAKAKVRQYSDSDLDLALAFAQVEPMPECSWVPAMQYMERWWDIETIAALSRIKALCDEPGLTPGASDLIKIGFCRTLMERSKASFGHQSVSLKHDISHKFPNMPNSQTDIVQHFQVAVTTITEQAREHQPRTSARVHLADSRELTVLDATQRFTAVVTSPPYANRMSYIRELRPYMYWLGFLDTVQAAGDLDWRAIGGTWGRATSNLATWSGDSFPSIDPRIAGSIDQIEQRSLVLGRYIRKYVCDMAEHLTALRPLLAPGTRVTYVVGNSRFYEIMLDTEQIFAELFTAIGLQHVEIRSIRKRTSKRELFEFAIMGQVPSGAAGAA